jgi:hypothetical protein
MVAHRPQHEQGATGLDRRVRRSEASPRDSNAFEIDAERISPASMATHSIRRIGTRSGSSQLVNQEV